MPIPPSALKLIGITTLSIPTLVIFSLVLTSCTSNSPGLTDIYLISINSPNYTVRAGYFGVCAGPPGSINCPALPSHASNTTTGNSTTSNFELLQLGLAARHKVFFPYIETAAAVFFVLALPLALWSPFRIKSGTKWDTLIITFLGLASFLSFMATMACIPGRNGMSLTADSLRGDATVHAGMTMFIFHWISFAFCFLLLVGFVALAVPGMLLAKVKGRAAGRLGGRPDQSLEGVVLGKVKSGVMNRMFKKKDENQSEASGIV